MADNTLSGLIGGGVAAVLSGVTLGIGQYIKVMRERNSLREEKSGTDRSIAQDDADRSSMALLLESAQQWKAQFSESEKRNRRLARQLLLSEGRMRRLVAQAASDRAEDRHKIEQLARRVESLERENARFRAQMGGRRAEDTKS